MDPKSINVSFEKADPSHALRIERKQKSPPFNGNLKELTYNRHVVYAK